MKFQILILTQRSRSKFLDQLLSLLEPQINALGLRKFDQVDILITEDDYPGGALRMAGQVGDKREVMRKMSQGEYIAFLDDDDLVAPDYISSILPLCDGVDQIGFNVQQFIDGKEFGKTFHTLSAGNWRNEGMNFYRDISHINPMRRELALLEPMSGGFGEDRRWADAMRGKVKSEHRIDKVLYYYLFRQQKNDITDANDPWRLEFIERLCAKAEAAESI